jgi:hypothetical protein
MRLNQSTIRNMFYYEPFQGILYKHSRKSRTPIKSPSVKIKYNGDEFIFKTSTIIYMYMKGLYCPYIRREDGNPANNKWFNFKVNKITEANLTETEIPWASRVFKRRLSKNNVEGA